VGALYALQSIMIACLLIFILTMGLNSRADTSLYINDVALAVGDSLIHLYATPFCIHQALHWTLIYEAAVDHDTILHTSGPSLDTVLTDLKTSFNAIQHSFRGLPTTLKRQ
jgi:hypothetical protein